MTTKKTKKLIGGVLIFALVSGITVPTNRIPLEVKAAETQNVNQETSSTMITGGYGSIQLTLSTGEKATVEVDDGKLKVNVEGHTFTFADYKNVVDQATVSDDDFLHFCTFSHDSYCLDLRHGSFTLIPVYRNMKTWEYTLETAGSEPVKWDSLIDNKYYFQQLAMNKSSRERLITREQFEKLVPVKPDSTEVPTPTMVPTAVPTVQPTQVPSVAPTEQPTQVPTAVPTAVPTQNPSGLPSGQPTVTFPPTTTLAPNGSQGGISGTIDVNWWYQQYISGHITWDRLMEILGWYNYKGSMVSTATETTYYFYDESGKLIKTETVKTGTETSTGTGTVGGTIGDKGQANLSADITEKGQATVQVSINGNGTGTTKVAKTKVKTFYYMKPAGNHRKLMIKKAGQKAAALCAPYFNKKKGILKWDKNTYKNIKYVSFTSDSRQILAQTRANKILIIARAKSKSGVVYKVRKLKGTWKKIVEDNRKLVPRVSNGRGLVKSVGDLQPVKVKVKK